MDGEDWGRKIRHPSRAPTGVGKFNGLVAKKFAIAVAHQSDAATHETNGRVADRRGLPWLGADPRRSEQAFGDAAIGGPA